MRKHAIAALAAAVVLLTTGGAALADWTGPATGPAALSADAITLPAGSLWDRGTTPACRSVTAPPEASAGEAVILTGMPGGSDQWCGAYAHVLRGGALLLPGGVPGERLTPAQYAAQTGQTVTVVYQPAGGVVVYLPA